MKLLFCCEFYYPSLGGVQEVMRQLAERMVTFGHDVTVATSTVADRDFSEFNGVKIAEFAVSGNLVRGLRGEVERYRKFVSDFSADAILINASQQWTFDALWPVLGEIKSRKVFIPCGFSRLHYRKYAKYYREMPDVLRQMDHLIFCADQYRDTQFARDHGLTQWSVIPNAASEEEFGDLSPTSDLRRQLSIPEDSFLFLTVGSLTGLKGHAEVAEAFARMDAGGRDATLVLNANLPPQEAVPRSVANTGASTSSSWRWSLGRLKALHQHAKRQLSHRQPQEDPTNKWIDLANQTPGKRVLRTDLPRPDLIKLFQAADLFVFASKIEYSPLVLFESAAASTPFLSVPVGNAVEIARWTGGGMICPAPIDKWGNTQADPAVLADAMARAMRDGALLARLGETARKNWQRKLTWEVIARQYENVLLNRDIDAEVTRLEPLPDLALA